MSHSRERRMKIATTLKDTAKENGCRCICIGWTNIVLLLGTAVVIILGLEGVLSDRKVVARMQRRAKYDMAEEKDAWMYFLDTANVRIPKCTDFVLLPTRAGVLLLGLEGRLSDGVVVVGMRRRAK